VSRVNQLDADLLDADLVETIKEHWTEGLRYFKSTLKDKIEPEITAVFHLIVYGLTVGGTKGATYGAQLQNLRYRDEFSHHKDRYHTRNPNLSHTQKIAYGALLVGGQYFWTRLNRLMISKGWADHPDHTWRQRMWRIVQLVDKWYHTLTLINFVAFLYSGRYKSLLNRLLGMRLVYSRPQMQSQISYEYLNRQMVWYAFT
ncbi:Pex12 amino terminal region-domain-containing protein, partial [Dimargaris cristalligena]